MPQHSTDNAPQLPRDSCFLMPNILAKFQWGSPSTDRQIQVGQVKIGQFLPISHYVSETVQCSDIVTIHHGP